MDQIATIKDLDEYEHLDFKQKVEKLLAYYLVSTTDPNSSKILLKLLVLSDYQFKFVLEVFKWIIAIGHDRQYPEALWIHFETVLFYITMRKAKIGLIHVLLLESLSHPNTAFKLQSNSRIRKTHELIISEFANDENLIGPVFKLLSGIGTVYQPECLTWLMKSVPSKENYNQIIIRQDSVVFLEKFIQQMYEDHLEHIQKNKDQLEYFIMLLNILIDKGSTFAFRLRDEII